MVMIRSSFGMKPEKILRVVVLPEPVPPEIRILSSPFTAASTMDISVDDPSITLIGLCQKLHMSFDKHIFSPKLQESPISSASMSKEMLDILRYIELNITKEIREEDIAAYCHYSVSYFSKLFHKVIGISFRDYICNKRIAMAKRLLVDERNAKIAFIAYQCGYHDVSYFSRIFKKKTGISPGVFRQIHS